MKAKEFYFVYEFFFFKDNAFFFFKTLVCAGSLLLRRIFLSLVVVLRSKGSRACGLLKLQLPASRAQAQ